MPLETYSAHELTRSVHRVLFVSNGRQSYICKQAIPPDQAKLPKEPIRRILRPINAFVRQCILQDAMVINAGALQFVEEAAVLKEWSAHGIRTPAVLACSDKELLLEYVRGESITDALENYHHGRVIDALAETKGAIDELAMRTNRGELLHTDPHTSNFLYARRHAYAIDPGKFGRPGEPLWKVVARSNLFIAYDLVRGGKSQAPAHIRRFFSHLNAAQMDAMREIEAMNPPQLLWYNALHNAAQTLLGTPQNHLYTRRARAIVREALAMKS